MQSHKILKLTEQLFLMFLRDTTNDPGLNVMRDILSGGISKAIADTLEAIRQDHSSDLLYILADIIAHDPDEVIAGSPDEYNSNTLFVAYKQWLYYRGDSVAIYLSGKLNRELNARTLSSQLSGSHLLAPRGMELSGSLPKSLLRKLNIDPKDREHYYKLSIPALADLVWQTFPNPFDRLTSPLEEIRTGRRQH